MTRVELSGRAPTWGGAPVVLPCFSAGGRVVPGPGAARIEQDWQVDLAAALATDRAFRAAPGETSRLVLAGGPPRLIVALGLGPAAELDADRLREAAMFAAGAAAGYDRVTTTLASCLEDAGEGVRAVAEGFVLGGYRYRDNGEPAAPARVVLAVERRSAALSPALSTGLLAAETGNWVRRLVHTPGGELTPADLADELRARARMAGVRARVWSTQSLHRKGFGGVLGVGSGSANPPVVVELRGGDGPMTRTVGLAGKGITFDSGGLNLKRDPHEISWMKSDMAAAAAVAGAVCAAASLGESPPVLAVLPLAENLPGGRAMRPGDVLTHPDGRTTEVTDTDAEGRLVLADAIAALAGAGVGSIVDVGTLFDGGSVGDALWGCWGSARLSAALVAAGAAAGEPGWALPLRREYDELLRTPVADSINSPTEAPDSAQLAATYLRPFAHGVPWVHIDNGSTAYLERTRAPWPTGPTGSPARALLEFLRRTSRTPHTEYEI